MPHAPLPLSLAQYIVETEAKYVIDHFANSKGVRIYLCKNNPLNLEANTILGHTRPYATEDKYDIHVAAGILGENDPQPGIADHELKATLLNTLETLYHESRHIEQFRAMSGRSRQRISGLETMATEWLATTENPDFYTRTYSNLAFELDTISAGFEHTLRYWDKHLRPYISESELYNQMIDRCHVHSIGFEDNTPEDPLEIIDALRNMQFSIIRDGYSKLDLASWKQDSLDLFAVTMRENPRAKSLLNLWDNNDISDDERLELMAGFNWYLEREYRSVAAVLSDKDWNTRGLNLKRCALQCKLSALFSPNLNTHAMSDNFATTEVQEAVDTVELGGSNERIEQLE